MKFALAALFLVGFSTLALSQKPPQTDGERTVRDALEEASKGHYTGSTQKELEVLGDASAVSIIKIFSDRVIGDSDIGSALLVIDLSFSGPHLVAAESDRKPRATMLLLRYLECQTSNAALKQKITETKKSLHETQ